MSLPVLFETNRVKPKVMEKIKYTILLWMVLPLQAFTQHNTYYVGHSGFGWDLIVGEMVNDLATNAGLSTYDYNFQFIGGTCLSNQWMSHAEPQGGTDSRAQLATGAYDVLVLAEQIPIQEVINGSPWGCDMTSFQAIDNFYDLAVGNNAASRVYLMEFHNEINLTQNDPYGSWTGLNAEMRPLWEQVVDEINAANSGPDVHIVPVAAAFQELVDRVRAGTFPGITDWLELFDPNDIAEATIHPTEMTYYQVACVHYATIFGQSPVGLTNETVAAAGFAFDPPTPEQARVMQEIAWQVVQNDSYSGVSSTITAVEGDDLGPELSKVTAYPNPAFSRVNFESRQEDSNIAAVTLTDLAGKQYFQALHLDQRTFSLDRGSLAAGIYVYTISDTQGNITSGTLKFE